jgi:hypothetical protein
MPTRKYEHVPEPGIIRYDAITGSSTRWNCIVPRGQNGAPLYVRVGGGGAIETSADGDIWTSRTSGTANMLNFVIYDDYTGKFWAVGASGTMLSSPDGITWGAVSLPVDVATDNLTGIASNGAGNFAVSNGTTGARGLVSTDNGASFVVRNFVGGSQQALTVAFDGTYFVAPRSGENGSFVSYVLASNPNSTWVVGSTFDFGLTIPSLVISGGNRVMAGRNGVIFTSPLSGTPTASNWTVRTSGTTEELRLFVANGSVFAVGSNGVSLMSTDGVTFTVGPPVGVTSFLRYGVADPHHPTRALVVGDGGVMLEGQYGLRVKGYADETARTNNDPIAQSPVFAFADQPVTGLTVDLL